MSSTHVPESRIYRAGADLCAVAVYFNPMRYRTKRENFDRFAAGLDRDGVPLFVAECQLEARPFQLSASQCVLRVRSRHAIWQKERLLNLLLPHVPRRFTKIAWLDADVLFEDRSWAINTSRMLDRYPIGQPFSRYVRMERGEHVPRSTRMRGHSFASVAVRRPVAVWDLTWPAHGHTGFAWAARRQVMKQAGFYDCCVAGGADHLMAHAVRGDYLSRCVIALLGYETPAHRHFARWALRLAKITRGRIGSVTGRLRHLWHGDVERRRYLENHLELQSLGFDPRVHLRRSRDGVWQWSDSAHSIAAWSRRMFRGRDEDDARGPLRGNTFPYVV